jgi:hypothetical protein
MLHRIRFRDQPGDIAAGGNPDLGFFIPECFDFDIFAWHIFHLRGDNLP